MNLDNIILIPAICSFGVLGVLAILFGTTCSEKTSRAVLSITVVCIFCLGTFFIMSIRDKRQQKRDTEWSEMSSMIAPLSSLESGPYNVIDTYRDDTGNWIALLCQGTGTALDEEEITIDMKTFGKALRLVNIGTKPIASHNYEATLFTGLAKVSREPDGKVAIRNATRFELK